MKTDTLYRTADVERITGLTERQVDHWARRGILRSAKPAGGSGTGGRRGWAQGDIDRARIMIALIEGGLDQDRVAPVVAADVWSWAHIPPWIVVRHGRAVAVWTAQGLTGLLSPHATEASLVLSCAPLLAGGQAR